MKIFCNLKISMDLFQFKLAAWIASNLQGKALLHPFIYSHKSAVSLVFHELLKKQQEISQKWLGNVNINFKISSDILYICLCTSSRRMFLFVSFLMLPLLTNSLEKGLFGNIKKEILCFQIVWNVSLQSFPNLGAITKLSWFLSCYFLGAVPYLNFIIEDLSKNNWITDRLQSEKMLTFF